MNKPRLRIRQSTYGNGSTFTLGHPGMGNWAVVTNSETRKYKNLSGYRRHLLRSNFSTLAQSLTNVMDQAGFFKYQVAQLP